MAAATRVHEAEANPSIEAARPNGGRVFTRDSIRFNVSATVVERSAKLLAGPCIRTED